MGIIGLVVGVVVASLAASTAVNNDNRTMMRMMGMNTSRIKTSNTGEMGMSMDDMADELDDMNNDDFDKTFLSMMIAHHQGAISMAQLAQTHAKHDEIKQLSKNIIDAQTKEIQTMQAWQKSWGYANGSTYMHM